jgi:hypothetical protein
MNFRITLGALLILAALTIVGCGPEAENTNAGGRPSPTPAGPKQAAALPENGFKGQITLASTPARLRAGQKETIQVKVRNASDARWYARGGEVNTNPDNRFYLAVGNRWLKADGKTLVTNMDGRYGLPRDLAPGEEVEVPLQITAPQELGEYVLEVDLIQEQVAWFSDKGSPAASAKVAVVR